jgi:tetratricopeptide (TPR) repeat protein
VWGDFDDAIAFAQKLPSLILQEFGDEPCPRESILAHLYWMKGDHLQALQLYRKAATVLESDLREKDSTSTNAIQRGSLAEAYAALGRSVDAQRVLDRLKASAAYSDPFRRELLTHTLAYTYLLLGQKDAALDQLEVGLTQPSFMSAQEIRISPDFAALHGNQRFADILTRSQALADSVR